MKLLWSIALLGMVLCLGSQAFNLPGVPAIFTSEDHPISAVSAGVAEEISREFVKYLRTGVESERLKELGRELRGSHSKKAIFTESLVDLTSADQYFVCTICRSTINVFVRTLTDGELSGPNREAEAKKLVLGFCDYFSIATPEVCSGLFDLNWPILDFIFNETAANSQSFCGMLPIPICQVQQEEFNLTLTIEGDFPTESNSDLAARSPQDHLVLHLTDIHYDPEYNAGGNADCDEPMCCRSALPQSSPTSSAAGYWSDYRDCDTPKHLILSAFDYIKENHKIEWIYHTGDVPPHNVWSTTRQGNIDMLTEIDGLLTEYFPETPVYSCLGNHEPHPANVFGNDEIPDSLKVDWLYEHVWKLWSKWLPAEAEATVRRGGYYTISPSEGHRIIALNSMDCYLYNWWLFYNGSLIQEQLQWFHDTLLAAEQAAEKVHILSHIPSGDGDCWPAWANEYNRVLNRFSGIITGIFSGHTHKDEMNLHYTEEGLAVAINWNGGSLTTYSNKNPNYRLYVLSPPTRQVVEHFTYTFNLTAANLQPEQQPEWYLEYEFTKEFTEDTSPAGIDKLLVAMAEKPALLRKFWRYKVTSADPKLNQGCDSACLSKTLCRIATSNYQKRTRCRELQAILEKSLENEEEDEEDNDDGGAPGLKALSLASLLGLLVASAVLM
ncbi:GL13458 [Drosophila persimilis]|uniref:Sphingomyelin phosphodiesterase n=1 Tax=Drosophila persimilis TaxID=7234 RepID=B4GNM6_DROPE|nr:sphingomyelin phosphodiesterase [Drosophila persimilis]EDW39352.1 GL13458 [Drosophila persimilis]